MSEHDQPQRDNDKQELSTAEYQKRLLNKLNCLIAVLEVAIGKITTTVDGDESKAERLGKIRNNLENTLGICRRAKRTLEAKIEGGDSSAKSQPSTAAETECELPKKRPLSFRNYVELSSIDEFRKFKKLEPISEDELSDVDLDELAKKLGEL
jgi:translation initiation factor 1 (eIF-1/SUI1)